MYGGGRLRENPPASGSPISNIPLGFCRLCSRFSFGFKVRKSCFFRRNRADIWDISLSSGSQFGFKERKRVKKIRRIKSPAGFKKTPHSSNCSRRSFFGGIIFTNRLSPGAAEPSDIKNISQFRWEISAGESDATGVSLSSQA